MRGLTAFQDAFQQALRGNAAQLAPWLGDPAPSGLAVYRNTVAKGAVDALAATFPTVERLVGEEWFAAAASLFARSSPPREASLLDYGEGFPAWLDGFEPAADMPYLGGAARLDGFWIAAYFAADAAPLSAEALSSLDAEGFQRTRARLHPSVRLAWFEDNTPSLWIANRPPGEPPEGFVLEAVGEGVLIARPGLEVEVRLLDAAAFTFLAASSAGSPLAECAARCLAVDPAADFPAILRLITAAGVFVGLEPTP